MGKWDLYRTLSCNKMSSPLGRDRCSAVYGYKKRIAMRRKVTIIGWALLGSVFSLTAQSVYPGQHAGKLKLETVAPVKVKSFDVKDVRLLPSRFRENLERDSAWMAAIEVNRLLHSFRTNAGVYAGREGGYMTVRKLGGWESLDCELRGHTTGHLLSAYGLMYAATGSEVFKLKGDSLVKGLSEVQQALGGGYLSAFPEELIRRNLQGKSVWAPWYTLHKLFSGLIDQYLYADNRLALEVVTKMGDWAYGRLHPQTEETRRKMIRNEFGGVNESFYNLYAITGEERYRWLAEYFYHNDVIDPLKEQRDDLGTKHTNTLIRLRYPSWSGRAVVKVNGRRVAVGKKGSYMAITRTWQEGDRIEADFPMQLTVEATPDNPRKAALLYGPVVLAGERGTEGMEAPAPFSDPRLYNDYYTYDYHIPAGLRTSLRMDVRHPERTVRREGRELRFTTPQGDVLRPLYDVHRQRYVVYWDVTE